MTFDPAQELAALQSEQTQIANNYKEAERVLKNCEIKLQQLYGAIEICKKAIPTTEKPESKKVNKSDENN